MCVCVCVCVRVCVCERERERESEYMSGGSDDVHQTMKQWLINYSDTSRDHNRPIVANITIRLAQYSCNS